MLYNQISNYVIIFKVIHNLYVYDTHFFIGKKSLTFIKPS